MIKRLLSITATFVAIGTLSLGADKTANSAARASATKAAVATATAQALTAEAVAAAEVVQASDYTCPPILIGSNQLISAGQAEDIGTTKHGIPGHNGYVLVARVCNFDPAIAADIEARKLGHETLYGSHSAGKPDGSDKNTMYFRFYVYQNLSAREQFTVRKGDLRGVNNEAVEGKDYTKFGVMPYEVNGEKWEFSWYQSTAPFTARAGQEGFIFPQVEPAK